MAVVVWITLKASGLIPEVCGHRRDRESWDRLSWWHGVVGWHRGYKAVPQRIAGIVEVEGTERVTLCGGIELDSVMFLRRHLEETEARGVMF
jgi:hypothetical protein